MSNGDESLEDKFERILGEDGIPDSGDEPKDEPAAPAPDLTRRQKRFKEREEQRLREEKEIENLGEYWYKDPNISIKIPKDDAPFEVLDNALLEMRASLETLKRTYCRSKRRDQTHQQNKIITESYLHEIKRHVLAIEGIKDIMAARALDYRVYYTDREHPTIACRRIILDCFVATTLYGPEAFETNVLRLYRDAVLLRSRAGRFFTQVYYKILGPSISRMLNRHAFLIKPARWILDRIIVRVKRRL